MTTLSLFASIALIGLACQWIAWKLDLPAILFLLLSGLVLGPVTGVLEPDVVFSDVLFPMISLAVAVILFEGSLTLKFSELKDIGPVVRNMVTFGALINAIITTVAVHYLVGIDWSLSALFGAIMVVTGPTVIVPLLRTVKPTERIARTLRWEGIVIDPLGALFAVVVFEWIIAQQSGEALSHALMAFFTTILTGLAVGLVAGYAFGQMIYRYWVPEYLHNFFALAMVSGAFAFSNELRHESGLLAVTVMGIMLANMPQINIKNILNFKEDLTTLLVSSLFIILAARVDFSSFESLGWGAVGILLVVQFISRPIKVFISSFRSVLNWRERVIIAWIGPRGIVAAAVIALFVFSLESRGFEQAELLIPLAFAVIMGTVIIQSATARPIARLLGEAEIKSKGYLILGANPVARAIGRALVSANYRVLLADNNWANISAARLDNLGTYYGSLLSSHADSNLDLVGIGGFLGLSQQDERNQLASAKYTQEFASDEVYCLAEREDKINDRKQYSIDNVSHGRELFGKDISYGKLASLLANGGQIKSTNMTEEFGFVQWLAHENNNRNIPIFAVDDKDNLHWFAEGPKLILKSGWKLFSLEPADEKAEAAAKQAARDAKAAKEAKQRAKDAESKKEDKPESS